MLIQQMLVTQLIICFGVSTSQFLLVYVQFYLHLHVKLTKQENVSGYTTPTIFLLKTNQPNASESSSIHIYPASLPYIARIPRCPSPNTWSYILQCTIQHWQDETMRFIPQPRSQQGHCPYYFSCPTSAC